MVRRVGVGRVHRAGVDGVEGEPAYRVCICGAGGVGLLRDGLRLGGAARLRGTGRARVDELDPVVGDVRVLHRVRDVVGLVSDATRRGGAGTSRALPTRYRNHPPSSVSPRLPVLRVNWPEVGSTVEASSLNTQEHPSGVTEGGRGKE